MDRAKSFVLLAGVSAMAVLTAPGAAGAQQAATDGASVVGIEEVIVTAQRRSESVLTVPMSIQAQTGEQLLSKGIQNLTALQFTTPGYLPNTGSGFTQIFIRGVGNTLFVGADPSVAAFVDDVPRIYGTMADNLVNVERVEVLKGAQGGLYGRNATGGVVNIITRRPTTDAFSGDFRISLGERDTLRASAYLNIPMGEKAALNVAVQSDTHDAFVKNIAKRSPYSAAMFPSGSAFGNSQQTADFFNAGVKPSKLHDQNFQSYSAKLYVQPADSLSLTFSGDYHDKRDNNGQGQFTTTAAYSQAALAGLFSSVGITTNFPAGFIQAPGKFEAAEGAFASTNIREYGASLTAVWNGPGVDLTSISAYRTQRTLSLADSALIDVPTVQTDVSFPHKRFYYQEVRAASTSDGPLQLLGGVTYLQSELAGTTQLYILTSAIPLSTTEISQKIRSWSIYGQAAYDVTENLTFTVSGRYIREKNLARFLQPVADKARSTQDKFVPSATLSYRLDGGTAYVRWARGFKTGGINLLSAPLFFPTDEGSIFGPETVDTYEAGYRQALFDRRVQFTATVFYNSYKDLQVSTRPTPAFPQIIATVINAKSARTYGAETTVSWQVAPQLLVGVNAGYLNAKYKDFRISGNPVIADFDQSGDQMPNAPKFQLSLNAGLDQPLNDDFRLVSDLLVSRTSKVIYLASALPSVLPDASGSAYWLTNARIGIRTTDDRYGLALIGENLFNKGYYTSAVSLALGNSATWGNRRVIRAELSAKF